MKLNDFSALCFDMDFTLLNYALEKFVPFIYNITARYLVEQKGYPQFLLNMEDSDYNFIRRGLVLDETTHCFLDVSSTGKIISALWGKQMLSEDKILEFYPNRQLPMFRKLYKHFDDDNPTIPYILFDSVFTTPAIPLLAKYIDYIINNTETEYSEKCKTLYSDFFECLEFNYFRDNFKNNSGFYFPEIKKNISCYIEEASDRLKSKLKEFQCKGIKMIVVTSAPVLYTEFVMNYSYGSDWRDYFDVVCCRARKPGFFSLSADDRPFYCWDKEEQCCKTEVVSELNTEDVFLEGHWTVVDKWIKSNTEQPGKVAYVGDSFRSDIIPTRLSTTWDLITVVFEGRNFLKNTTGSEDESSMRHVNKKPHIAVEGWNSFFGSFDQPSMCAAKLLEYSDLTISNIEVLADINLNSDFSCTKSSDFWDFDPYCNLSNFNKDKISNDE